MELVHCMFRGKKHADSRLPGRKGLDFEDMKFTT
jgi:hypothetical protein